MTSPAAETILATPVTAASSVFPGDQDAIKQQFRTLAALWHPDHCSDPHASDVLAHLVALRDHLLHRGLPRTHTEKTIITQTRTLRISPLSIRQTDQAEIILGQSTFAQLFHADFQDLAAWEARAIGQFRYADLAMQVQMQPFLPQIEMDEPTQDGGRLIVSKRSGEDILLCDMLEKTGPLPAVHAAWVGSGLLNIAAWLTWSRICHGAIAPDTILIDPTTHSVRLMAGWCFSTPFGRRPQILPSRTLDLLPALASAGEVVDASVDLHLIRQTLREVLGDPAGSRLSSGLVPQPLADWINLPPVGDGIADYIAWQRVLRAAWGQPRFIPLDLDSDHIYGRA